jgi:hypothetical protein
LVKPSLVALVLACLLLPQLLVAVVEAPKEAEEVQVSINLDQDLN